MATSRRGVWLRWFGSTPHLMGAIVALVLLVAALLGIVETVLRHGFDRWWWVVIVLGYGGGWLVSGVLVWAGSRLRGRRRSLRSVFYPALDRDALAWLSRRGRAERHGSSRWPAAIGICLVLMVGAVLAVIVLGPDRAALYVGVLGGVASVLAVLLAVTPRRDPSAAQGFEGQGFEGQGSESQRSEGPQGTADPQDRRARHRVEPS